MKKLIPNALVIIISLIFIASSCQNEDPVSPEENGIKTLTIAHMGVDWSEGKVNNSDGTEIAPDPDGETIGWCPNGSGGGWGTGLWYRAFNDKIYRIGSGNLSDATSIDTTKWSNDVCDTPLVNGDMWAAECKDGFVIFKVTNAPMDSTSIANNPMWEVKVEYKFSSNLNFN